jgi:hypothetical protein
MHLSKSWHYDRAKFPVVLVKKKTERRGAEQGSSNGTTEGGAEYRRLTKCLAAYNEIKGPTQSGICFAESPIRSPASLLKKTRRTVQQLIRAFAFLLTWEPNKPLKGRSDLQPCSDAVDTSSIPTPERE